MIYIGVDPGLTGAVARLDTSWVLPAVVVDMPTVQIAGGKGKVKREVDACNLADILASLAGDSAPGGVMVCIERQQSLPAVSKAPGGTEDGEDVKVLRGAASGFSIGVTYGMVRGVVGALKLPYQLVMPAVWKRSLRVGRDKELSRSVAIALYPEVAPTLARKKDHNRAEAILIAVYAAQRGRTAADGNPF